MRIHSFASLIVFAAGCQLAHAQSPAVADAETKQFLAAAGQAYEEALADARKEGRLDNDVVLKMRIEAISDRIFSAARKTGSLREQECTVSLVDSDQLSAHAFPHCRAILHTGLIHSLNLSDDEIASVLGTLLSRDPLLALRKMKAQLAAQMMQQILQARSGGSGPSTNAGLAAQITTLPLEGQDILAADRKGVLLLFRAGYQPAAAVSVIDKLEADRKKANKPQSLSVFGYPGYEQRRKAILEAIAGLPAAGQ